jgi:hypothetical protein
MSLLRIGFERSGGVVPTDRPPLPADAIPGVASAAAVIAEATNRKTR